MKAGGKEVIKNDGSFMEKVTERFGIEALIEKQESASSDEE